MLTPVGDQRAVAIIIIIIIIHGGDERLGCYSLGTGIPNTLGR